MPMNSQPSNPTSAVSTEQTIANRSPSRLASRQLKDQRPDGATQHHDRHDAFEGVDRLRDQCSLARVFADRSSLTPLRLLP